MSLYDSAYRCKWLFMKSIHSSIRSVPKAVISDLFRDVRNASHHERESRDMIQRSDYFPTLYRFLTFVHWHSLCKICFLCLKDIDTFSDHQQRWCSVPRALIKCPFLLFLRLPVCFLFVFVFFFFWWSSIISLSFLASPGAHSKRTDRISRIVPLGSRDDANDVGYNQGLSHDGNSTVSLSLVACRVATLLFVFVVFQLLSGLKRSINE